MTKTGLGIVFLLIVCKSYAQQDCLILIDAENNQPFYARLGGQTFPSSAVGHLMISHLKDSTYQIMIGFPGKQVSEMGFMVRVLKKDQGFQLKNPGNGGWVLYNWQSRESLNPVPVLTGPNRYALEQGIKKDDAFSRLMANVVNDSLVMYNTYVEQKITIDSTQKNAVSKPEAVMMSTVTPPKNKEITDSAKAATAVVSTVKEKQPKTTKAGFVPRIVMLKSSKLRTGLRLVYLDHHASGVTDTIRMIIPYETASKMAVKTDSLHAKDSLAGPNLPSKKNPPNPCKNIASDYDIDVFRVNVLTENTLDMKMSVVRKFFAGKCVTVAQVKALSELFVHDKNKLEFFQAAYPAVSDREHFKDLGSLISDPVYQEQFTTSYL